MVRNELVNNHAKARHPRDETKPLLQEDHFNTINSINPITFPLSDAIHRSGMKPIKKQFSRRSTHGGTDNLGDMQFDSINVFVGI